MSITKLRKKTQKESAPGRAFRGPASRGRMVGYSISSVVVTAGAVWVFLTGNELTAMVILAVGVTLGAVAYDNWRRLDT